MLFTLGGAFMFHLLCGLVPCTPKYSTPEILTVPNDRSVVARNLELETVPPLVKTKSGTLEGYLMKSTLGKDFFAFEGIPYGESTAGPRRWKPPVPKRPWRGVRQAKKPGSDCTQINPIKLLAVYGSEDCLFANVYSPSLPSPFDSRKLPVVVFIHGGSFILGSGSEYGPAYMLNQDDVIYVNFNYRLGPLGFISTGDDALVGNYGLKDQALALKWVYENIEFFGGNPKNISLWGSSAGAVSVNLHLISNKTRDYFTTAFSSSGTAFQHWAVQSKERLRELTWNLARRVGCSQRDSFQLVRCLENVDSNLLVVTQLQLFDWFPCPPVLFSPIVEPEHPDAFLTISPEEAYKTGNVAKKPYAIGMTKEEGKTVMLILLPLMKMYPLRVLWDKIAPVYLQYRDLASDPAELTRKISDFYFKGKTARTASLDAFADMMTDRYLSFGVLKGAQAHASTGAPTYLYYFSFSDGNHNLANTIGYKSPEFGASHTEDMFYLFNNSALYDGHKLSDPDHQLSTIIVNIMSNLAKTGEPTYTTDNNKEARIWEPVINPSQIQVLQFDRKVEMIPLPANVIKRVNFWTTLNLPEMSLWRPLNETNHPDQKIQIHVNENENII